MSTIPGYEPNESLPKDMDKNFEILIRLSPFPILVTSFEDGRILFANDAFTRSTGQPSEVITSKDGYSLKLQIDSAVNARFRDALRKDGRVDNFKLRLSDKSNQTYSYTVSAQAIHYQGQPCILSTTASFIPIKQETLRERKDRFFNILERIAEGYFEVDLDGYFTYSNKAMTKITGYSADELKHSTSRVYLAPGQLERVLHAYKEVYRTGSKKTFNYTIVRKDGTILHVETSAGLLHDREDKPKGFYGVMRDRTEQRSVEEVLKQSEESYRNLLELAPDPISISRLDDGRLLYVNDAFCQKSGFTVEEAIGRTALELNLYRDPKDRESFMDEIRRHGILKGKEMARRSKDGSIRHILVSARSIRFLGQNCLLRMVKEITHLKEVQKALERSEESLEITLNSIGEAVIATDTDGKITRMNPVAEDLTEWSMNEALGRNMSEVFIILDERSRKPIESPVDRVLAENKIVGLSNHTVLVSKSNRERHISDSAAPIRDANGDLVGVVLVFRDVTAKRKVDKKLRESEKKHRTVLESMEEGYYEINLKGDVTNFNASILELHGYSAKEFMGMNFKQYLHPETAEKFVDVFAQMYETGLPTSMMDYEVIRKDGSTRLCEMSAYPMKSPSGEISGFWGIIHDRTARRSAEIALQESEARMRTIFENAAAGIVYYNILSEFIRVNRGFCDIVGYTANELLLMKTEDLSHPDDRNMGKKDIERLLNGDQKSFRIERRLIHKSGATIWCKMFVSLAYGDHEDPMYFVEVIEDITERKMAKEALQQSEERNRLLVDNANEGIYITRDGRIQYLNPKALDIFGADRETLINQPFVDLVHPDDREVIYEKQQRMLDIENRAGVFTFRILNMKKEVLWVELSTVGIDWEDSLASLNFLRDVTQQKKMESQLLQAQKMEAVGTLAGGVAHDFNNLLMGIQGNVSLTLIDVARAHPHYQRLKNIEAYVQAGADLTRQLLGAAKGGKYDAKITDLNRVLDKSSELFGRTKKEITIHKKFQKDLWMVEVDRGQIDQVLLNLYVNAWQAMPEGGKLIIESRNITLDADFVKPFGVLPGDFVQLSVTDNGEGIDMKCQKRIFDPFFTTKGMSRGTGLGLASAYGIIVNHGGMITVYSEKGSGSTFNIFLPASDKKIDNGATEENQKILIGNETVLLVDDEDDILDVGRLLLENLGYRVIIATGGDEALEKYRYQKDEIDLILLDVVMPGKSGSETFDAIKAINPSANVILSSGYSINGQAKEIIDRGCNGFIQKPYTMNDLSIKLRHVLDIQE